MRVIIATAVLLLASLSASAATITSISPSSVKVNSGEQFLTVFGTGLGNTLVFDGPAGHFERTISAAFSTNVVGWVPEAVMFTSGTYKLFVRGSNGDSNTVNFTVVGFKFFPLVILAPDVLRWQAESREGAFVKYDVMAAGGEDSSATVSCLPESGSFFKLGNNRVDCTASNKSGERATASFTVTVADDDAPVLSVPEPIQVRASSREGAVIEYKVTAADAVYGEVVPDCLPRSGTVFPIGVTNVSCTATDFDLNVGTGSFTVEVLGDQKFYTLNVLVPDKVVEEAGDPRGNNVKYDVKVTGTSDPNPEVKCSPDSGSLFPVGVTSVRCDAIDVYGMRGTATFDVDVRDSAPPDILRLFASPSDISPSDGRIVKIDVSVTASDKIDVAPYCEVFAVTSNESIDLGDGDDPKAYQWKITGQYTLELRATANSSKRVYDIWTSCTDFYGNSTRMTTPVTVSGRGLLPTSPGDPVTPTKRRAGRH